MTQTTFRTRSFSNAVRHPTFNDFTCGFPAATSPEHLNYFQFVRPAKRILPGPSNFSTTTSTSAKDGIIVRRLNLPAARKMLGTAIGMCPKEKLFKGYIELSEFDRARQLYEKYIELDPTNPSAWIQYAQLEENLGDSTRVRYPNSPPHKRKRRSPHGEHVEGVHRLRGREGVDEGLRLRRYRLRGISREEEEEEDGGKGGGTWGWQACHRVGRSAIVGYFGHSMHMREVVEAVTVIETSPMIVVARLSDEVEHRFYMNEYRSMKKYFTLYAKKHNEDGGKSISREIERIRKYCTVIRTRKKARLIEIRVNSGSVVDKVEYAQGLFGKPIEVRSVFKQDEVIEVIAITKGNGSEGITHRWGTKKLPKKTHKGFRKVACIGAWHPSKVMFSVARAGQNSYHHRTELNKKIYRIGKGDDESNNLVIMKQR
ncbi:hypothetical protein BD410DRAFT_804866 [Rickenella mellea]|uniref:Ribosomal protein L3 n=1 Tax=Rickenella mellea TaxID=50990 RepID=A0A4Y7Q1S2_9AGAM|nr:hypothetical protein BD410DRAFT_804866 [Rickenella mellea]